MNTVLSGIAAGAMMLAAALAPALAETGAPAVSADAPPLISRQALFGNPDKAQLRVSPSGDYISWLAPKNGMLNIFVAPRDNPAAARSLTDEKTRPIRQHFWAQNSKMIMWVNDTGGDENFRLFGVNVETGEIKTLTDFEKTRTELIAGSISRPDEILVGLNNRDPQWHDVYRLNIETGELTNAILRPLLIAQGANDPRVKRAEADQIVDAMRARSIPVTYVLYPDEGHGFARPENNISFSAVAEAFLTTCLGGRYEPIGSDFTGASLEVLEGAGGVPGLEEALGD